jgi:choline dehydrogenase
MADEKDSSKEISRREFVKKATEAGVAAATLAAPLTAFGQGWKVLSSTTGYGTIQAGDAEFYDYIVVGSGAGGGTVACRLVQKGKSVLLIEAGDTAGEKRTEFPIFNPKTPVAHAFASEDAHLAWGFYVKHYRDANDPQKRARTLDGSPLLDTHNDLVESNGRIFYPRGSTVGGSTAVNAMITLYPNPADWEGIRRDTCDDSWSAESMWGYYNRLDHAQFGPKAKEPHEAVAWSQAWLRNEMPDISVVLDDKVLQRVLFASIMSAYYSGMLRQQLGELTTLFHGLAREVRSDGMGMAAEIIQQRSLRALITPQRKQEIVRKVLELYNRISPNHASYVNRMTEGLVNIPRANLGGYRFGTRDLIENTLRNYPNSKSGGKLRLESGCLVTKVIFDEMDRTRAIGVAYVKGVGAYRARIPGYKNETPVRMPSARLRHGGEVILAGGAFNTPQLLMLSGIGDHESLSRKGIRPRGRSLPGVGKNLQDRYEVTVISKLDEPMDILKNCKVGQKDDPCLQAWEKDPSSHLFSSNGVLAAFEKRSSSRKPTESPDLMVFGLGAKFPGYKKNYSHNPGSGEYVSWAILKGYTENTAGQVTLKSQSPYDTPEINFHYFEDGSPGADKDLQAVVDGVNFVRETLKAPVVPAAPARMKDKISYYRNLPTEDWLKLATSHAWPGQREELPGPQIDTAPKLEDFVRRNAWGHHASCTAKMGLASDPTTVVDSKFRVHGIKNLRVVDASVFPRIPGLFIAVPTYLVGEKAAAAIMGEERDACRV